MTSLPSLYSAYEADTADISVHALFAAFDETTHPVKVFVFDAIKYVVDDEHITPVKTNDTSDVYSHIAEYISSETVPTEVDSPFIVYHIDGMGCTNHDEAGEASNTDTVTTLLSLSTLHELTHWGLDTERQPETRDHWDLWNGVLLEEIEQYK